MSMESDSDDDRRELPAADDVEVRRRHELNRSAWNEGAAYYTNRLDRDIEMLRNGGSTIHPIERELLGDLRTWCRRAIHLQCASGADTLSLWREGAAEVIGIDISDVHITNARRMAEALGAPARWYRCDVLDTPPDLGGADLVYTGRGALPWLHDLTAWAHIVARLLVPGGMLLVFEDHPFIQLIDTNGSGLELSGIAYFDSAYSSKGWPETYIGNHAGAVEQQTRKYERIWTISDILNALIGAGLRIEHVGEYNQRYWGLFPDIDPETIAKFPMTLSVVARRDPSPTTPVTTTT